MNLCIPFLSSAALMMMYPCDAPQAQREAVHVHDGDTLTVDRQSYRLNGIDAPELAEPGGIEARDTLRTIVGSDPVDCMKTGRSYNRIVAICSTPTFPDIGAELIRRGFALDCRRYSGGRYREIEAASARERLPQKKYCR